MTRVYMKIDEQNSYIEDGKWEAEDSSLKKILNTVFSPKRLSGYIPDVSISLALLVEERLKGKIIKIEGRPKIVKGRIY